MEREKIIQLLLEDKSPTEADEVLKDAIGELVSVMIVGKAKDGGIHWSCTSAELAKQVYYLELAKAVIMRQALEPMES